MKKSIIILSTLFFILSAGVAQKPFAIKKWKGRYPSMKNDYPLTFVCFKGWLPPVPHFFARLYPSHYYYYLNSFPVSDGTVYTDVTVKHALRTFFKNIDKKALKESMEQVSGIKLNQEDQHTIESFLKNSRVVVLDDVFDVGASFAKARAALDRLGANQLNADMINVFERELNHLMKSYVMLNLMDAKQGHKLKSMEEIRSSLKKLTGSIHYCAQKINYYQSMQSQSVYHLSFLGNSRF
ncbi:hypothetical protein [Saccharicrinis sp. GN24d3]|uniref:hypothetical protein n=1 Tax=Saccharicrinis sp. GN24d3 TaxID=3458416 RepID=UPI0040350C3E